MAAIEAPMRDLTSEVSAPLGGHNANPMQIERNSRSFPVTMNGKLVNRPGRISCYKILALRLHSNSSSLALLWPTSLIFIQSARTSRVPSGGNAFLPLNPIMGLGVAFAV